MTIRLTSAVRDVMLAAIAGEADAGAGNAALRVYTGSQPATADIAPPGNLLVTFALADPAFVSPAAGVMAFDADPDIIGTPVATGTAGWARLIAANGSTILDGTVGTSGDFVINTTAIVTGQDVILASASLNLPA